LKSQIKNQLSKALKIRSKSAIIQALRQAAKFMYFTGDKDLAKKLISFALDFSDQSNQYFLILADYHYFQTGEKINSNLEGLDIPLPSIEEPWEELAKFIDEL